MKKTIIIYYSWTGTTDIVAHQISEMTSYPMERIIEVKGNKRNMVNAAVSSFLCVKSKINPLKFDIESYDNIILGTPVWVAKLPPAINTFLKKATFKNKKVWIFMSKSTDEDPISTIEKLKKYLERRGGIYMDTLFTKSIWVEDKITLPKVVIIHS